MPGIYLDNAATSFPKPEGVRQAINHFQDSIGASAGRGAYDEAFACADLLASARGRFARLINAPHPGRVIFTHNTTAALNLGIKGILGTLGGHVITSAMEHNSVLRPLHALRDRGLVTITRIPCSPRGELDPADVRRAIRSDTRLLVFLHASNVCGAIFPIEELAATARNCDIPLLVDAAQTAGSVEIDVAHSGIDMLAVPGHKGLLGPLGTGALWVRGGLDLQTVTEGGTGSVSEEEIQPPRWPDRHEAGSHNALGIAGLNASLDWLLDRGVSILRDHKRALLGKLIEGFSAIEGVTIHGPLDPEMNAGVVSISVRDRDPGDFARELDRQFGIKVRPGLHCAPGAHRAIGSFPHGTVRFSIGPFNKAEHIQAAVRAVDTLCHTPRRPGASDRRTPPRTVRS